jgi:hypothetical protein
MASTLARIGLVIDRATNQATTMSSTTDTPTVIQVRRNVVLAASCSSSIGARTSTDQPRPG